MNYEFESGFTEHILNMLEYRTAMGRSTINYRWNLANFDRFCLKLFPDTSILTKEIAIGWCNESCGGSNYRAQTIRGFAKYLVSIGEAAFVLPRSFFTPKKADLPYILSDNELQNFFDASDQVPSDFRYPLLEYTVPVVFRLQYACGMRPQEVRQLKRLDFNFTDGTLYIAEGKHYKDRILAVSSDIMNICRKYDLISESINPGRVYFFQSPNGGAYASSWLTATFHKCWKRSGNSNERGSCVPYDLRHNYATQLLMSWIEEGKDLNAWIPYLSTYMGHVNFSATFYYIHLLPERLSKMDFTSTGNIIPEVDFEKEIE